MARAVIAVVWVLGTTTTAIAAETGRSRSACVATALKQFTLQMTELDRKVKQRDLPVYLREDVFARRRLEEDYCTNFVECLETPPEVQGSSLSRCLDVEAEERLRHETK